MTSIRAYVHSSMWGRAVVVAGCLLAVTPAAEARQTGPMVMIDVGNADGPPGRTLSVPVNIAVPEGTQVTEFEMDVRFPKEVLAFVRAELAPQGRADNVKIATTVRDDPENAQKQSILQVKATGEQALGSGAVMDLFFRINPKAKAPTGSTGHKAARITADLDSTARVRLRDGQLADAGGRDGAIDITEGVAIFGCFFYMH